MRGIKELRQASDDELIREHDALAKMTVVGTDYYVQELDRRSRDRSSEETRALAHRTYVLTIASTAFAAIAVVVSVVALLVQ